MGQGACARGSRRAEFRQLRAQVPSSLLPSPATMELLEGGIAGTDLGGSRGAAKRSGGLSVSLPSDDPHQQHQPFAGALPSPGLMAMADAAEVSNDADLGACAPCLLIT